MMKNHAQTKTPLNRQGTLGTFSGVFTPSILTILGIILFLRLGYVVGNAGLGRALMILVLANGISVLTSISLSAIATNIKVKGGGDYYLISRTLGPEFGGALGIVLFLAQSVSIGFYCHRLRGSSGPDISVVDLWALWAAGGSGRCGFFSFYFGMAGCRLGHTLSVCGHGDPDDGARYRFLWAASCNGNPQIWCRTGSGPWMGRVSGFFLPFFFRR